MNKIETTSPRIWLREGRSDRSLDATPMTPSRLLSPCGKNTMNNQLSTLLSPEGVHGIIAISGQLKDLLETLPSRQKGHETLKLKTDPTKATKTFSRRERLRKTQSDPALLANLDSTPSLPSRVLSPEGGSKKGLMLDFPSRGTTHSQPQNNLKPLTRCSSERSLDSIPSLPSRMLSPERKQRLMASQAREIVLDTLNVPVKKDSREVILDRIPAHVRQLLPKEEWYRILEPSVEVGGNGNHSICSDLTDRDWMDGPSEQDDMSKEMGNEKDAVERSKVEDYARLSDQETKTQDIEEDKTLCVTEATVGMIYNDMYCSGEGESKDDTMDEVDHRGFSLFTSGVFEVMSKAHPAFDDNSEVDTLAEIPGGFPLFTSGIFEVMSKAHAAFDDNSDVDTLASESNGLPLFTSSIFEVISKAHAAFDDNSEVDTLASESHGFPLFTSSDYWVESKAHDSVYKESNEKTKEIEAGNEMVTSAQESGESTAASKKRKRVSFGTVQIRWHERILAMHPCTSSGPSIGIGWGYYTESEEPIGWNQPTGQRTRDLRLTREDREQIVADLGYSPRDIARVVREILKIKNQRRRTIHNLKANLVNVEKVESIVEECNRKIRKLQEKFRIGK